MPDLRRCHYVSDKPHIFTTNVLLQPITAISEGLDGVEKIYDLRFFSNAKSAASIKEVRQTADQVYGETMCDCIFYYGKCHIIKQLQTHP